MKKKTLRIAEFLEKAIEQKDVLRAARAQLAYKDWEQIVGPLLGAYTRPDRYSRGTLWVYATGSSWAQETSLMKDKILDRLNQMAGEENLFEDLKMSSYRSKKD